MRSFLALRPALLVGLALPAVAQTTTWLRPEAFAVRAGSPCAVAWEAEGADATARGDWEPTQVRWLFVRDGGRQLNLGADEIADAAFAHDGVARLGLEGPGVAMTGLDRVPRTESVPRARIQEFLHSRIGEEPALAPGAGPVEVRRLEGAKLLLRVIDDAGRVRPSPVATSKSGQACEIRPLLDPTRGPFGGDLPLRVYLPSGSKDIRVRATHVPSGDVQECRTDTDGLAHFRLRATGEWRVEAHRALAGADGVLEIQSATLVFEVPGEAESPDSAPAPAPREGDR